MLTSGSGCAIIRIKLPQLDARRIASTMAESSASTSDRPGPSKKAKRDCRYQQDWRSHGMLPSARGPTFACCKYCNTDINVAHGGVSDIKKHLTTSKHREIIKATGSSGNLTVLFRHSLTDEAVTRAEG